MYWQKLWQFDLNWPVFSDYIVEDGYIKPGPGASYEKKRVLDLYREDWNSKPVHVRLANLWQKDEKSQNWRIDESSLLDFVREFGLLGLGRRFSLVEGGSNLGQVKLLTYPHQLGELKDLSHLKRQQRKSMNADEGQFDIWQDITPYGLKSGSEFFKMFFPRLDVNTIPSNDDDFWKHYCEPIGRLQKPERYGSELSLEAHNELPRKISGQFGDDGPLYSLRIDYSFRDTLAYHIADFALSMIKAIDYPDWPLPGTASTDIQRGLLRYIQTEFGCVDKIPPLQVILKGYRSEKKDRYKWDLKLGVQSLLDACYLMLLLDLAYGRQLARCPWCEQVFKLNSQSSSNRRFCNEGEDGASLDNCSARYHKLKSFQKLMWNRFLIDIYKSIDDLEADWGMRELQEKKGEWKVRGPHAVKHPMDIRDKQSFTPRAKANYIRWRNQLRETVRSKNNRVLKDDYILSKKITPEQIAAAFSSTEVSKEE